MLLSKFLKTKIFYFLLTHLFFQTAFGQQYISKQITTYQALPDNNVSAIFKDSNNRLWVGTYNGLALFKGKKVNVFKKKEGLAHNSCSAIVQDKRGQIWIATFGGLSLYKNGQFQNFTIKNGLPSNKIRRLFLKGDDLFIGTSNGFSKINITNFKIKNYPIQDKRTDKYIGKRDFEVLNIIEVKDKIVFNTHSHGIYLVKNDIVTVLNKSFYSTFLLFKNKDKIYIGKNGHAEQGKSINVMDEKSFLSGKSNYESLNSPNTIFWDIIKTKDNALFAGANGVEYDTGGVYEIQKNAKNVNSIFGIKNNKIWSLFYDITTNLLYIGTLGDGLYIVDLDKKLFKYNSLNTIDFKRNEFYKNVILYKDSILIEKNQHTINLGKDDLYAIIKNEINKMPIAYQHNCDGTTSKFEKKGFLLKTIALNKENIYINTNYGLLKLSIKNRTIQKYLFLYSIDNYKFDGKSLFYYFPYFSLNYVPDIYNQNYKFCFNPLLNKAYPQNIIDIIFTKKNKFFISKTKGLYVLKAEKNKEFEFPLLYDKIEFVAAAQKANHQIVLGTIDGDIFMLDDKSTIHLTKLFDKRDIIGTNIYKILNYQNYVLIFTERGINCIHIKTKKSFLIDEDMGIKYKNMNAASLFNNILLIATDEGAYEINIEKYLSNKNKSPFPYYVDHFFVNDTRLLTNRTLKYDENKIHIQLGSAFHLYPNKLLFQYQLKGLNNSNWNQWTDKNTIDLPYVPPGKYELMIKYKDLSTGETGMKTVKKFQIMAPLWQNIYFIICSILSFGCLVFLYVKRKINSIKKRELERNNFEKRIVETKMEALQSQMNPHFVFNSLNVIQNFVIKNDIENSIVYINNFSKLMRTTLENSSEFKISVAEEIKFLKLYVEVQRTRFNNQVKFKTVLSPEIDKHKKLIPPMLIQPLLENCFEHAFDDTIKKPKIILEILKNFDKIVISVSDNGLGFQEKSHFKIQSKALKLVEERIKLLGNENQLTFQKRNYGIIVSFTLSAN